MYVYVVGNSEQSVALKCGPCGSSGTAGAAMGESHMEADKREAGDVFIAHDTEAGDRDEADSAIHSNCDEVDCDRSFTSQTSHSNSFGKRTPGCTRRTSECLILEPSEMIVIDYPDVQVMKSGQRQACNSVNIDRYIDDHYESRMRRMHSDGSVEPFPQDCSLRAGEQLYLRNEQKRCSRASDTSSAYSGSDMMQSSIDDQENVDADLSGLQESNVDLDSDEEEGYPESELLRDAVQECLQKDPADRTEDDIGTLLEFIQHFRAFANMTLPIRRALCSVMVFAVVEKQGQIVMNHGEELDSWSVILNGQVEIDYPDGAVEFLHMGDCFGITPTMEKLYHQGVMKTVCDDCQFVCVAQQDYYKILHQGEENTRRHEEEGSIVLVTEHRIFDGGNRRGHIVIRGTAERLMQHLVEDHSVVDPTYVEDFLLCYRMFLKDPSELSSRLKQWFEDPVLRPKVTRVVLLWVNNHFIDFEMDACMCDFLEKFEKLLERELSSDTMIGQSRLLNIACAAKACPRTVTLTRATREEVLHFSVLGGQERGFGIFISKVERASKAYEAGLKRGDQILEVNGSNFLNVSHNKALETLRGTTHLSVTVKYNLRDFKEMLLAADRSSKSEKQDVGGQLSKRLSAPNLEDFTSPLIKSKGTKKPEKKDRSWFNTLGRKNIIKKFLPRNSSVSSMEGESMNKSDESLYSGPLRQTSTTSASSLSPGMSTHLSASNPDLSSLAVDDVKQDLPDHVVKVYRADQSFKFLPIHKETTAREVVMLALQEFGVTDPSSNYSLCEVTVENESLVKQKRLPEQLGNLPERQNLNGRRTVPCVLRYYLKNNMNTETLVPDELRADLIKEAHISLLQLNTTEVASQITLEDFKVFKDIESTEYVDNLLALKSKYGCPNLKKFEDLVNKEMFWVVTEVCSESNIVRRVKLIKHFIKIARHCKDCKNFNTMFAVVSGLSHSCVDRLRNTWEKVPNKYTKMYNDLKDLMDPSRNMSKYRNLISSDNCQPPMLPFFPVVKKDLTFIHLANDSYVDALVNFEKVRMIAKEVRHICNMASAKYNVSTMFLGTSTMYENSWISGMATMKRVKNRRGSAVPNAKKMYEEAQMVRRVKSYLSNMKVIPDEEKLKEMSHQCEAPPLKKTDPSASSITASMANLMEPPKTVSSGPKFGAESPEAIRKLMGLTDKVRPHNSKHSLPSAPNLTSPMSGRRQPTSPRHARPIPALHLSPESSSVVSLSNIALRKPSRNGSMGSGESASPTGSTHSSHQHYESDSSRHSMSSNYDTQSTNSASSNNSPPQPRKFSHPSHPPQTGPTPLAAPHHHHHPTPPIPQPPGVRPPLPTYDVVMQKSPAYSQYIHQTYTNVRRPPLPDYRSATQMAQYARQKHTWQLERTRSHDGVVGYHQNGEISSGDRHYRSSMDDAEEEQVSAV
ncbi:rap guanine nucleotide exchange factor 2-like isoform X4 [Mizuhopecten yessoensis]|uniref:rap guanine nucleotide exchange factor 2-like isoform X4 n=1 Tax=Mizuhopecten yessoensis TaxID=6573 RepID=UPI000B45A59A|nr:rap guanine nucleotide exchange factor 2-like isoform X4 [Mizuhopecten yessoensis]